MPIFQAGYYPTLMVKTIIESFIFIPNVVVSPEDWHKVYPVTEKLMMRLQETGYLHNHIQATKANTIGTGLNDSPMGLAAYILEKFVTWADPKFAEG